MRSKYDTQGPLQKNGGELAALWLRKSRNYLKLKMCAYYDNITIHKYIMNENGAIKNSTFKRVQKQVKKLHQNWMCNFRGGNGLMSQILPHPSLNQNIYHPTPTPTRSDKVERKIFHLAGTRPKSIHFLKKSIF